MSDEARRASVRSYNRRAWDRLARGNVPWSVPVTPEVIARARAGELALLLTPTRPVPAAWLGDVRGKRVLALASGGGQQGPCLAAAGAIVTVLDNSPEQLARDRLVAERDGLELATIEGDMSDLSGFADESFELIFHPCSNCFVSDIRTVWREAHRVLARGGELLAGFANPVLYALDLAREREGVVQLVYRLPFSPFDHPDDVELERARAAGAPLEFGHTLEDQLGGQLDAGLVLIGMFEDDRPGDPSPIHRLMPCYLATRARKP